MKIKLKKKKYSSGGQIAKDIGAGAYGLGEGLVDNLTSVIPGVGGLVDAGTDKLFNMLNKGNKEAAKVRAVGDVVGNVGGAILTGGATTLGAVTNGIGATNDFIQNTNMSDKGKQITGIASGLATTVAGLTGTGKVDGVNGLSDIGKMIKYKKGGAIQNNNLIPYNLNDLAGVSNNLIRYDGNTHSNGGIPTPSGEFDKQETVLNSKEPYAFSDNLLITKPLAQMQGLPRKYVNKTIADASKMVDNKYKIKVNQPTLLQNANRITADNKLNDLVKTNEMLINAEQQLGTQFMCGGKLRKYANGGVMRKFRLDGNPPLLLEADGSQTGNWQNQNIQYDQQGVPQYQKVVDKPYNATNSILAQNIQPIQTNGLIQNNSIIPQVAPSIPSRYGFEKMAENSMETPNTNPYSNKISNEIMPDKSKLPMFMQKADAKLTDAWVNSGMTPLEAASLGTKLASHAYEFASVLKKPDKIQTQYNEFNPQVQRLMREQKVNNQPILNELNLQSNMLFDRNVGNANTQRANNLTVNSQLMDKINQVKMASQTANNQYRTAEANSLNQIGQQNVQARNTQEALQSATNAARDNAIREAFGNVGNDLADYGLKRDVNNKTIREGFKLLGEDVRFTNIKSIYTTPESYMKALQRPEIKGITGKLDSDDTLSEKEIKYLEDNPTELSLVATIRKGQIERLFDLNTGKRKNPVATATPKERKTEAEIAEKEAKTEK